MARGAGGDGGVGKVWPPLTTRAPMDPKEIHGDPKKLTDHSNPIKTKVWGRDRDNPLNGNSLQRWRVSPPHILKLKGGAVKD